MSLGRRAAILSHEVFRDADDSGKVEVLVHDKDFLFGAAAETVLIALDPQRLQRNSHTLQVIARLAPDVTRAQAQAELDVIGANLARLYPKNDRDRGIAAVSLAERVTATVRAPVEMLLGAVGLLLLIACANVANLLLSRAAARQTEMAVRVALGASRVRLAQQLLTESLLLAAIGGTAGFLLALAVTRALASHLPPDLSRAAEMAGDMRLLVFTAVISLATGALFGLSPLVGTGRTSAGESLRMVILAAFSMLALVMASIAIYGVMNYLVIQRTREFGIRVSMGATRGDVLRLVLGRAAVLIGAGTCLGLAGSVGLVRLIAKLLFGTAPLDPLTFAAAPALLAIVALAASYLPAWRATRVDPMVALRYE